MGPRYPARNMKKKAPISADRISRLSKEPCHSETIFAKKKVYLCRSKCCMDHVHRGRSLSHEAALSQGNFGVVFW